MASDTFVFLTSQLQLCKVKYQERDVTFGIAVYDVDYDDYDNECGSINKFGENSRLKALRKIVDYCKNLGGQMFNEASCTSAVVPPSRYILQNKR
ncbi:hypothetical protein V5799_012636 [Amblyomma americanum]|uniref:Uncharacterized protein n=1 Tax=Amblyomma americanum TaxID=6943 RepID=A0AAQ4EDM5_AMBAM